MKSEEEIVQRILEYGEDEGEEYDEETIRRAIEYKNRAERIMRENGITIEFGIFPGEFGDIELEGGDDYTIQITIPYNPLKDISLFALYKHNGTEITFFMECTYTDDYGLRKLAEWIKERQSI